MTVLRIQQIAFWIRHGSFSGPGLWKSATVEGNTSLAKDQPVRKAFR
jgi:hypothetical protein